jgi:tRNA G46 methylase TrmB
MPAPITTLFDEVRYLSGLSPPTHPDQLATMATLFGMWPAPVAPCRVLELGCSDGSNLIAMAYGPPQSQFVGIDLTQHAIVYGKAPIEALGLKSITSHRLDLRDTPSERRACG